MVVHPRKKKKTGKKGDKLLFDRTFYPGETKEIRLFGLAKDDTFEIIGESQKSIKIRVIGGIGEDLIMEKSKVAGLGKHTFIYETNINNRPGNLYVFWSRLCER